MSLIKKPAEIVSKEVIAALIYGQSGMGKTTLACSAPSPVLIDFDGGASRLRDEHQVPTVQVQNFKEALAALDEIAAAGDLYKTVIVDTASKMIDSITFDVCGSAQPQIRQWGTINAKFKAFLRAVQSLNKNIIFVAQREVEKNGEDTRYVPQFRASNYKDVICDLDICGYMEMATIKGVDQRIITFNPSARSEGKNTADFAPSYILPTLQQGQPNTFLSERFGEYVAAQKSKMAAKLAIMNEVAERLEAFTAEVDSVTDALGLNELCEAAKKTSPLGDLKLRMSQEVARRAKQLGLTINKETRLYE